MADFARPVRLLKTIRRSRFNQKKLVMLMSPPSRMPRVNGMVQNSRLTTTNRPRMIQLRISSFRWRGSFSMGFTL